MLKRYHQLHPELRNASLAQGSGSGAAKGDEKGKGRGKRRTRNGVFNVLLYKEDTQAAEEVIHDSIKEPLTFEQFERLRVSHGFSSTQARAEWETLRASEDAVSFFNEAGKDVLEVEVKCESIYRSRFTRSKTMTGSEKPINEATQQEADHSQR